MFPKSCDYQGNRRLADCTTPRLRAARSPALTIAVLKNVPCLRTNPPSLIRLPRSVCRGFCGGAKAAHEPRKSNRIGKSLALHHANVAFTFSRAPFPRAGLRYRIVDSRSLWPSQSCTVRRSTPACRCFVRRSRGTCAARNSPAPVQRAPPRPSGSRGKRASAGNLQPLARKLVTLVWISPAGKSLTWEHELLNARAPAIAQLAQCSSPRC